MSQWGTATSSPKAQRLNAEKVEGFYWRSTVHLPDTGMRAIYEGQASFAQLQFLSNAMETPPSCAELRKSGYLFGIYVEAFERFLKRTESDWPETMIDPIIELFLLVCDLAINPTRGFPIEVEIFDDLILDVDVGVRSTRLCLAVGERPHLKKAINEYSKEEYISVAAELTELAGYDHPLSGLSAVVNRFEKAPGFAKLMEEHRTFEFDPMNLPIRVFLSHLYRYVETGSIGLSFSAGPVHT